MHAQIMVSCLIALQWVYLHPPTPILHPFPWIPCIIPCGKHFTTDWSRWTYFHIRSIAVTYYFTVVKSLHCCMTCTMYHTWRPHDRLMRTQLVNASYKHLYILWYMFWYVVYRSRSIINRHLFHAGKNIADVVSSGQHWPVHSKSAAFLLRLCVTRVKDVLCIMFYGAHP